MVERYFSKMHEDGLILMTVLLMMGLAIQSASAADIDPFVGDYSGSLELNNSGAKEKRDMSVQISKDKDGFTVIWESTVHKPNGRIKTKSYSIDFVPTDRAHIFSSAMKTNVFGHAVPLDPMVGDPYVWARITGDTLTVFSLHVDEEGGYELQQYNRTLTEEGLNLDYQSIRNGKILKSISTLLRKN
jgi:hypothetical protein